MIANGGMNANSSRSNRTMRRAAHKSGVYQLQSPLFIIDSPLPPWLGGRRRARFVSFLREGENKSKKKSSSISSFLFAIMVISSVSVSLFLGMFYERRMEMEIDEKKNFLEAVIIYSFEKEFLEEIFIRIVFFSLKSIQKVFI